MPRSEGVTPNWGVPQPTSYTISPQLPMSRGYRVFFKDRAGPATDQVRQVNKTSKGFKRQFVVNKPLQGPSQPNDRVRGDRVVVESRSVGEAPGIAFCIVEEGAHEGLFPELPDVGGPLHLIFLVLEGGTDLVLEFFEGGRARRATALDPDDVEARGPF